MSVEALLVFLFLLILILFGGLFFVLKKTLQAKGVELDLSAFVREAEGIKRASLEEAERTLALAKEEAQRIRDGAKEEARLILEKAQFEAQTLRAQAEERLKLLEEKVIQKKQEMEKLEQTIHAKESQLNRRFEVLEKREEELHRRERELRDLERSLEKSQRELEARLKSIEEKEREVESLRQRELLELQRIASMTFEEARREVLRRAEEFARIEAVKIARRIEEEVRERAELEAKKVITASIQRLSSEIAINYTTTTVELPSNEFKGRIIGREGRNIRTFELLTGVDLIIDDTPDVVTISSFDPLRREIAREALQRLIEDGRIHPARIEEVVNEVKKEMDEKIKKMGEETCMELGLYHINPGLYYFIGKLYYRTSYSQNVLLHSKEVAYIAGLMAEELRLDAVMARRAGLLHDIGKAVSHELGGSHTDIGVELCKKYGEPDPVLNAIKAHHNEEPVKYPEVALVCAADALSAARPGARRETLEAYLKRLEKLENIVKSFKGVANAYAVQAGREIRVMVNPEEMSDEEAYVLSKEIARRIEEEMEFPGQIKVVVIREVRYVEYAK